MKKIRQINRGYIREKGVTIDNNNNNKYISRALNPSVSNQPEAESAVHVQVKMSKLHIQLKPSKQRNQ